MQVDLDQKEIQILIYSINMYQQHLRNEAGELEWIDRNKKVRSQGFCCFVDDEKTKPNLFLKDENVLNELRRKFRKTAMQFPCEEHQDEWSSHLGDYDYE